MKSVVVLAVNGPSCWNYTEFEVLVIIGTHTLGQVIDAILIYGGKMILILELEGK